MLTFLQFARSTVLDAPGSRNSLFAALPTDGSAKFLKTFCPISFAAINMILKATIRILKRTVKRLKVRNSRKRKTVTGSSHRRSAPTSYKRRRSLRTRRGNDLPCACLKHVCFVHAHVLNAYADGFCTTVGNMPWTASAECLDGCFCPVALFRIPGIAHYCSKTTGRTAHLGERDDGHFSFLLSTMQMRRVS